MILDSEVPELRKKLRAEERSEIEIDHAVSSTLETELIRYVDNFLTRNKITTDYRTGIKKVVKEATEKESRLSARGKEALSKLRNFSSKWDY